MPVTEIRFFDTWEMLEEWGIWSTRQTDLPRYISPAQLMVVHNVQQNHRSLKITDEQAMAVDRALAQLKQRDFEMWICGIWYFIPPTSSYAQIAEALKANGRKINMQRVQTLVQSLVAWVDAACFASINGDRAQPLRSDDMLSQKTG